MKQNFEYYENKFLDDFTKKLKITKSLIIEDNTYCPSLETLINNTMIRALSNEDELTFMFDCYDEISDIIEFLDDDLDYNIFNLIYSNTVEVIAQFFIKRYLCENLNLDIDEELTEEYIDRILWLLDKE